MSENCLENIVLVLVKVISDLFYEKKFSNHHLWKSQSLLSLEIEFLKHFSLFLRIKSMEVSHLDFVIDVRIDKIFETLNLIKIQENQ